MWNYYRDEQSRGIGGENKSVNYSIKDSKSFDYKTSITGKLEDNNTTKDAEIIVPLKHLSNFWRNLNIPLIHCEGEIILAWSKNCVLTSKATKDANPNVNPAVTAINNQTNVIFKIADTKLFVPVVTFSKENDIKFLEKLKLEFKRTIKWNKYQSQMTIQNINGNLNYIIDPIFKNVNRLFVLSFKRIEENNVKKDYRDSFSHCYLPNVMIKDFNVLIDGKSFFDLPVKNEEEAYKKIMDMSNNNDYTTGNLLDFSYFKENYRLIVIDLSKQTKLKDPQQINFIGKIEGQNNGVTMFFIIEKSEETIFKLFLNIL